MKKGLQIQKSLRKTSGEENLEEEEEAGVKHNQKEGIGVESRNKSDYHEN